MDIILTEAECILENGFWYPFADNGFDMGIGEFPSDAVESGGDANECYCSADGASTSCLLVCGAQLGDLDQNGAWNVVDIIILAVCILSPDPNACSSAANRSAAALCCVSIFSSTRRT